MFTSPNEFSMHIEKFAYDNKITHTEAILDYCERHSLEPDDIKSLVSKSLKDKLAVELRSSGLLPRQATLEDL
jgi:hypothetical protein